MVRADQLTVSVRGPLHISEGKPNQDSSLIRAVHNGWLAIVCDGMGSKPFSQIGSKQACRAVIDIVKSSPFTIDSKELIKSVYQRWLSYLGAIKPTDAVTTCLFCWLSRDGRIRTFQLGDGLIVVSNVLSKSNDSNNFGNETTGLGKSTKFSDWKVQSFTLQTGDAVALMTDGISEDINPGMETQFMNEICNRINGKSFRQAKVWLKNELKAWATPNHTDDKSIALLVLNHDK
jgi:serine/threonine protein phosphatase PrpC